MYRKKDFLLMQVYNTKGKSLGFIKDILVDFSREKVLGFSITSYKLFSGGQYVLKEHILAFNNNMIVTDCTTGEFLTLNSIANISVIDIEGSVIGVVEDIVFDEETFNIAGLVISTGYLVNFLYGKKIILLKDVIIGRRNILYTGDNKKILMSNVPKYKIKGKDNYGEK